MMTVRATVMAVKTKAIPVYRKALSQGLTSSIAPNWRSKVEPSVAGFSVLAMELA